MRKLFVIFVLLFGSALHAQMNIGFFGMRTWMPQTSFGAGWGGGMYALSKPLDGKTWMQNCPVKMQIGGSYYVATGGQKVLYNVPVGSSQDNFAEITFSNMHIGFFAQTRFSMQTEDSKRIPYIDLFGGGRYLYAVQSFVGGTDTIGVTLSSYTGFSGGAGAGIMFRMGKHFWIDAGLQYQASAMGGKFVNMNSIRNTGDGLQYSLQNAPSGMMVFRVALTFRTEKRNSGECCTYPGCRISSHHVPSCEVNAEK